MLLGPQNVIHSCYYGYSMSTLCSLCRGLMTKPALISAGQDITSPWMSSMLDGLWWMLMGDTKIILCAIFHVSICIFLPRSPNHPTFILFFSGHGSTCPEVHYDHESWYSLTSGHFSGHIIWQPYSLLGTMSTKRIFVFTVLSDTQINQAVIQ